VVRAGAMCTRGMVASAPEAACSICAPSSCVLGLLRSRRSRRLSRPRLRASSLCDERLPAGTSPALRADKPRNAQRGCRGLYNGYRETIAKALRLRAISGHAMPVMHVIPPGLDFSTLKARAALPTLLL
jgi:hypothetical protein